MYDQIAQYYDLIHSGLEKDLEFLVRIAAEMDDPILELGCGTGRLLLSLSRVGHRVTGIDNSEQMLKLARGKIANETEYVRERIALVSDDIVSFNLGQRFGLIIIPYNTLFHLDRAGRRSCYKSIGNHLLPGGRLVIDIDNPMEISDPVDDGILLLERSMLTTDGDQIIVQMTSSWVDTSAQQRHMTWIFDASPVAGGGINRAVATAIFHYVNPHEFEEELSAAGIKLEAIFGDYDRSPFDEQSPRLLVLAEKAA